MASYSNSHARSNHNSQSDSDVITIPRSTPKPPRFHVPGKLTGAEIDREWVDPADSRRSKKDRDRTKLRAHLLADPVGRRPWWKADRKRRLHPWWKGGRPRRKAFGLTQAPLPAGSFRVPFCLFNGPAGTMRPTGLKVLIYFLHRRPCIRPSYQGIARDCGISVNTAVRVVCNLLTFPYVKILKPGDSFHANHYGVVPLPGHDSFSLPHALFDGGFARQMTSVQFAVYCALCRRSPSIHPSMKQIAVDVGIHAETVVAAVKWLELWEYIGVDGGPRHGTRPNSYTILPLPGSDR